MYNGAFDKFSQKNLPISREKMLFDTLTDAFDAFERMYKIDEMMWGTLRTQHNSDAFFDKSIDYASYTFIMPNRILTVELQDALEIAKETFKIRDKKVET